MIRMMVALCLAMPLWAAADQAAAMRRRVVAAPASNDLARLGALIWPEAPGNPPVPAAMTAAIVEEDARPR